MASTSLVRAKRFQSRSDREREFTSETDLWVTRPSSTPMPALRNQRRFVNWKSSSPGHYVILNVSSRRRGIG